MVVVMVVMTGSVAVAVTVTVPPPRAGAGAGSGPTSMLAYTVRRMLGEATARRVKRVSSVLLSVLLFGVTSVRPPQYRLASPGQGVSHCSMSGRAELDASR